MTRRTLSPGSVWSSEFPQIHNPQSEIQKFLPRVPQRPQCEDNGQGRPFYIGPPKLSIATPYGELSRVATTATVLVFFNESPC
jgi:hypothetical protein